MPAFDGVHRRRRRRGEVEAEVHLLIDFLALVDVGALIGEARFDRRVHQLLERALPQQLRRALRGERGDRRVVLLAQLAVDGEERRQQVARVVDLERRRVVEDAGHDLAEELVVDLDAAAAERLREDAIVERRPRLVAGFVAGEDAGSARSGPGRRAARRTRPSASASAPAMPAPAAGKPGIDDVADADARFGVGRLHAIDDDFGAAVVDEVVQSRRRRRAAA